MKHRLIRFILCALLLVLLTGCDEQVLHDLSEYDANRLITALDANRISARKIRQPNNQWGITVARPKVTEALVVLGSKRALPLPPPGPEVEGAGFLSSRDDQRGKLARRYGAELERTITSFPGVLEARVHINLPQRDTLFARSADGFAGSASALVIAEHSAVVQVAEVAALVAGATGIPATAVSVVVSRANATLSRDGSTTVTTSQLQQAHPNPWWKERSVMLTAALMILAVGVAIILTQRPLFGFSLGIRSEV